MSGSWQANICVNARVTIKLLWGAGVPEFMLVICDPELCRVREESLAGAVLDRMSAAQALGLESGCTCSTYLLESVNKSRLVARVGDNLRSLFMRASAKGIPVPRCSLAYHATSNVSAAFKTKLTGLSVAYLPTHEVFCSCSVGRVAEALIHIYT